MAKRGVAQDKLGQSFTSGSDFMFEFYCEVCRHNGLNAEADGYCPDCKINLCDVCTRAHKRTRLTRQHDVIGDGCIRAHKRTRLITQRDVLTQDDSPISHHQIRNDATLVKNDKTTQATHVADIDVKTNNDNNDCCINGSVVLSDTLLVIADWFNGKVKLVDTKANKLKTELEVYGHPFDVAKINDNLVAVSIDHGARILIIKVTDTLSLEREIPVSRDCRGVAYSQGKLLVTCFDSKRLDVIDLQGNIIQTISKRKNGRNLLKGPRHVCVSTDHHSIYVSDCLWVQQKVFRLTLGGEIKSVYKADCYPEKVCTDHCGNVYIAADDTKSVHMLTADCVKIKEVLTEADGLDKSVRSVSHCASTNRLYVGMWLSNMLKVYELST